jgi:phage tail tube protein FII
MSWNGEQRYIINFIEEAKKGKKMLSKILKNCNVFVDGRGYAGKRDEITVPKLTIKTEGYRAGGMNIPISIDM